MKNPLTYQWMPCFAFPYSQPWRRVKVGAIGIVSAIGALIYSPMAWGQPAVPLPATAPTPSQTRPTLQMGSQGYPVAELQALLTLLGYYSDTVDGIYQTNTANAVTAFQQAAGLQATGIVAEETWNRLLPPTPTDTAQAIAPLTTGGAATLGSLPSASTAFPAPSTLGSTPASNAAAVAPTPLPSLSPASVPSSAPPAASPSPASTRATPRATQPTPQPGTQSGNATPPERTAVRNATLPTLRVGMEGSAVSRLQERLRAIGVYSGAIDGIFGPATEAAVIAAQRRFNLDPDGVVGSATWTDLLR